MCSIEILYNYSQNDYETMIDLEVSVWDTQRELDRVPIRLYYLYFIAWFVYSLIPTYY